MKGKTFIHKTEKFLPVILLAVACQAYTPITERSWVKFRKVKDPTYETVPSTWGTRHNSCNAYSNRRKNKHVINDGSKICT